MSPSEASGPQPPADLPDPAALARLASEFFRALPGSPSAVTPGVPENLHPAGLTLPPGANGPSTPAAVPFGALPAGANLVPSSPRAPLQAASRGPALLPHAQAHNGVPENNFTAAPAYDGRVGSQFLGVPQLGPAAAPVRPQAAAASGPAPHAPDFYFLQGSGVPGSAADTNLAGRAPSQDVLAPESLSLPGTEALGVHVANADLRAAPGSAHPGKTGTGGAGPPVPAGHGTDFYFIEYPQGPAAGSLANGAGAHPPFDVNAIRRDFPILQERVQGRQLAWFDNAATTQKPQAVIDRLAYFYAHENSNIHRAAHELAARATDAYEQARDTVRRFIGAGSTEEIVFVRGTTEAINLVAKSWGARHIGAGDEIIISHLEHHANIVPWQQLAAEKGARIRVIPVDDSGQVLLEEYQRLLNDRTKLVSVTQVSNALGTVVPVHRIVELAHRAGARALVDGAQSVSHMRVDVRALDADFFVFSGHKIFGPTGIGTLYAKRAVLEDMPPWQGGGNMIADVTFERTVYQEAPARFEAGTGNIADAVGLGAALQYVERVGIENIGRYEHALLDYATRHMCEIPGVRLIGTAADKASVLSFVLNGSTTEEVGKALNADGIAVRTGHHCAQPILRRFGLETTVRPSLAFYNTCEEVDRMVAVVKGLATRRG
jgi:cysteine desulfurase/selenocysteine lyase